VSQNKYILDHLKETRKSGYRPTDTPMDHNAKLLDKWDVPMNTGRYHRLVGCIIVEYKNINSRKMI